MILTKEERIAIERIFQVEVTSPNVLKELLPNNVYQTLKTNGNLNTVCDKIQYFEANKYRLYDTVHITKFLTPDFDVGLALKEFLEIMSPVVLFFCDFHFMIETSIKNEEKMNILKFQRASKASSVNSTIKLVLDRDFKKAYQEIGKLDDSDLLNKVFEHHLNLFEFENSGFRPHSLVSLVLYIQKFENKNVRK